MAATLNRSCATPRLELGARSPGGLRLPDGKASAGTLYAPRGVAFLPGGGLAVCDTGNHRVLIWHSAPASHGPADVVLGQADFSEESPNGPGPEAGLHLPTGILVHEGRLLVADAWNHRVLLWNRIPESSCAAPDAVLGQASRAGVERNRGAAIGPAGFDCPYGLALLDGDLVVADTQNRRVLVFDGLPEGDAPARDVIGQDDFLCGEENRGKGVAADTFRWPHALGSTQPGELLVADAGNHRLLGFSAGRDRRGAADILVGQERFDTAFEMPHVPQGPARLRFPYALVADASKVIVGDTANNRVLIYEAPLTTGAEAVAVLGQEDFSGGGENRWDSVQADSLCWPYGLALEGERLAIADSGNNRIVVWDLSADGPNPEETP